jgi:hypothetical protein
LAKKFFVRRNEADLGLRSFAALHLVYGGGARATRHQTET